MKIRLFELFLCHPSHKIYFYYFLIYLLFLLLFIKYFYTCKCFLWRNKPTYLPTCLQDVFKTSSRHAFKTYLQEIFKTSWKTKNCYAEDVLKTYKYLLGNYSRKKVNLRCLTGSGWTHCNS